VGVLILNSFQSKAAIAINGSAFKQATYFHLTLLLTYPQVKQKL